VSEFSQLIKPQFQQNKLGWVRSSLMGLSQDEQGRPLPWMTYPFIEYISSKLNSNQLVFEYGCGSSTLFFAPQVKKVVALESSEIWYKIMARMIEKNKIKNIELIYLPNSLENSAYESFAFEYSNLNKEKFDLIIIDSLKRFACTKNAILALNLKGCLILDDSERKNYQKIFDFMTKQGFIYQNFLGIAPGQIRLKNTTLFYQKIASNITNIF
jgi:precorrin-6B methylase 2